MTDVETDSDTQTSPAALLLLQPSGLTDISHNRVIVAVSSFFKRFLQSSGSFLED